MIRFFAISIAVVAAWVTAYGNDNFVMTGELEGVEKDVLLIEYMTFEPDKKVVKKSVAVRDGRFEFATHLKNAWMAQVRLKSVPQKQNNGLFIYLVPDETLHIKGDLRGKTSDNFKIEVSGSDYYTALAEVREFSRPYLEAGLALDERYGLLRRAYVMSHPESEAAYSLVDWSDSWALQALENFSPEIRKGRFGRRMAQDQKVMQIMALQRMAAKSKPKSLASQGEMMPGFKLRKPEGGKFVSDSLRGKYAVIDFWGSWCIWCIRGIPKMKSCYERYAGRLNMVSIACSDSEEGWRNALKKNRMPWTQVISDDGVVEQAYNVKAYPFKVVVDPEGRILRTFRGEGADFYSYLEDLLGE